MRTRQKKVLRAIKEVYAYDNTPMMLNIEAILDIVPEIDADGDITKWVMKKALAHMEKNGVEELEEAVGIVSLPDEMKEALKLFQGTPIEEDFIPDDALAFEATEYVEKKSGLKVEDYDMDVYGEFVARVVRGVYGYTTNGKLKTTDRISKFGIMNGKEFKKVKDDISDLLMLRTGTIDEETAEKAKALRGKIIEKLSKKHTYLNDMGEWERGLFVENLISQATRNTRSALGGF